MTNSLQHRVDILQDRYALKLTARLSHGAADLPYDIAERLRAARVQAVAKRKVVTVETAAGTVGNGSSAALTWGSADGIGFWGRLGSVLPLVALVVGMFTINWIQNDNRAKEIAEVDAALLTDDLPPAAFSDPGFLQYLKTNR